MPYYTHDVHFITAKHQIEIYIDCLEMAFLDTMHSIYSILSTFLARNCDRYVVAGTPKHTQVHHTFAVPLLAMVEAARSLILNFKKF